MSDLLLNRVPAVVLTYSLALAGVVQFILTRISLVRQETDEKSNLVQDIIFGPHMIVGHRVLIVPG